MSPSNGLPYTLTGSHRLVTENKILRNVKKKAKKHKKILLALYLHPLVIIDARSNRKPSTCISVTQYLQYGIKSLPSQVYRLNTVCKKINLPIQKLVRKLYHSSTSSNLQ
jgi:hypothetical protein